MNEDKIEVTGDDNRIRIGEGEKIEIKGDENIIRISDADKVEVKGRENIVETDKERGIKENVKDIRKGVKNVLNSLNNKKTLNIILISLLILILIGGTWIRIQNLSLLHDSTTGEYIPLALDPFYFLRVAETTINGGLPAIDSMRYPALKIGFSTEFLPKAVIGLYKVSKIFNQNTGLNFIHVISPVIFFILGLVAFFFLMWVLTKSKWAAIIGSFFLAIIPTYLYRTMAGFADHESIGMVGFFSAMLLFALSVRFLSKNPYKKDFKKILLFSIGTGLVSGFTMVSWGGIGIFLFMIFPLSFLIFWLLKTQELEKKDSLLYLIIYYSLWMISSVIFGVLLGGKLSSLLSRFILSSTGLISLFVLGFIIIDYILMKNINRINFLKKNLREVYSLGGVIILGIIFLFLVGKNPFQMIISIWNSLISPFGTGRVGLTISENSQPYLVDWISQTGKILFWIFLLGLAFVGFDLSRKIKPSKKKVLFILLYIFMVSGILFSRISASSAFNGVNFISQAFYFIGLTLFGIYVIKLYFEKKFKLSPEIIIIASWMFFMLISTRSAVRFFFALTPFVAFMVGYSVIRILKYLKKNQEEIIKIFLVLILILVIIGIFMSSVNSIRSSVYQAKYTGPSANYQWQQAMSWVRENTLSESIFVHWWDYGYWVQYLGERATITDGGHSNGFWDHLIGRYVLTTPYPETALSFMKAHNVSYLLIDSTDLGKYPAYSKIGGDEENDRYSAIPVMPVDTSQTRETSTGTIRVYPTGIGVDEDIFYNSDGSEIFLPGPTYDKIGTPTYNSFLIGVMLEIIESENLESMKQPTGIFYYNGQQIQIPLRYVYYNGEITDFNSGIDSVFSIIPMINSDGQGVEVDQVGAGIYLSPKVSKSLFAQLYLLDDAFGNYPELEIAHAESSPVVTSLASQGIYLGEFVYYSGFQGPIKIWKIGETPNIIAREEFTRASGEYAEFDDLKFTT